MKFICGIGDIRFVPPERPCGKEFDTLEALMDHINTKHHRGVTIYDIRKERKEITVPELLKAVKDYAHEHYEEHGWDVLIECHTDAEIVKAIGKATTVKGAISNVARAFALKAYDDRRRDIQAEAF
jgi:hypothetical protein